MVVVIVVEVQKLHRDTDTAELCMACSSLFVNIRKMELSSDAAGACNIIGTPIRNLPPFRQFLRILIAICNHRAIIDFVTMQGQVQVGTVALRGR